MYGPVSISPETSLINDYMENGSGPIDYSRYIRNYIKNAGVTREVAKDEVDKIIDKIKKPKNEVDLSKELIRRHGGVGGTNPYAEEENSKKIQNIIGNIDNSEKNRQLNIASLYKRDPSLLSASEKRWIESNKTTVNGRALLDSLGIK